MSNNLPYITPSEAAKILEISKRTLFRWELKGKVNPVKREGVTNVRLYDKKYIRQTAEILRLDKLQREHLAKLPKIMTEVKKHLCAHECKPGEAVTIIDTKKAGKAFDLHESWKKEHDRLLNELCSYPKDRLRELLL